MCRNMKTLYNFDLPTTEEEIRAASLQFVRKISGFTKPSNSNQRPFDNAVDEIERVVEKPIDSLVTSAQPRSRGREGTSPSRRAFG